MEKAEAEGHEGFSHLKVCFKIRISILRVFYQHQEIVIYNGAVCYPRNIFAFCIIQ